MRLTIKLFIREWSEKTAMFVAKHLPREVKQWVIVFTAVKILKQADQPMTYKEMYEAA